MRRHHLHTNLDTLHGAFSGEHLVPALTIDSGDEVLITQVPDVSWGVGQHVRGALTRPRAPRWHDERGNGPAMVGPIYVNGTRAGDVLAVRVDAVEPGDYGWTAVGAGPFNTWLNQGARVDNEDSLLLWEIDHARQEAVAETGHCVQLAPFFGTMGLAPSQKGWHTGWCPTKHGGNMDWPMTQVGATLYLPVAVDGGLLSMGDTHARQGDGEVSGTAIECMMKRATLTIWREDTLEVRMPTIEHEGRWGTLGVSRDLEEATSMALGGMLDIMVRQLNVSRAQAMALASVVVDMRIAQLVNDVKGVYATWSPDSLSLR